MIQYPPITISGTPLTTQVNGYPDSQSIIIYNESQYFLQVSFVGSGVGTLAAYTADAFQLNSGFTGSIVFNPSQYLTVISNTAPSNVVFVQTYGANEALTRNIQNNVGTGYPISLNRLQNIGNVVNNVGGTASAVQNDGNAVGTTFIEATPTGDGASAVNLLNNGVLTLGSISRQGKITLTDSTGATYQLVPTQETMTNASSVVVYQVQSNGTLICGNGNTEILSDPSNETKIANLAGSDIIFQSALGVEVGRIVNNGRYKTPTGITLPIGGISRISNFSGGVNLGATVFNHGLGVVPDIVLVCWNLTGNPGTGHTLCVDMTTATSTQITVRSDVANSANGIVGLAIKF